MELYLKLSITLLGLAWLANVVNVCDNAAKGDRPGVVVNLIAASAETVAVVYGAYLLHQMY